MALFWHGHYLGADYETETHRLDTEETVTGDIKDMIKIASPPLFIRPLESQTLRQEEPIRFEVEVQCTPPPSAFYWTLNDHPIRDGDSHGFLLARTEKTASLSGLRPIPGQYRVVAVNQAGQATSQANVRIKTGK